MQENSGAAERGRVTYSKHGPQPAMISSKSSMLTVLALLPVLIIYIFGQNWFVQGITLSGMGGR